MDPQTTVIEGRSLADALLRFAEDGPVAVDVVAEELGSEVAFRARLVVGEERVPRDADDETIRWLQLAAWTPRVEVTARPTQMRAPGARLRELAEAANRRCREVSEPLQRVGGPLTVLVADLDRITEQIDSWPAEVGPILRRVDGVRPVVGVAARVPFPPNVTIRILSRLVVGGVLMVGSREPEGRDAVVSPEPLADE